MTYVVTIQNCSMFQRSGKILIIYNEENVTIDSIRRPNTSKTFIQISTLP